MLTWGQRKTRDGEKGKQRELPPETGEGGDQDTEAGPSDGEEGKSKKMMDTGRHRHKEVRQGKRHGALTKHREMAETEGCRQSELIRH